MSNSAVGGRKATLEALESTFPIFSQAPDVAAQNTGSPHVLERETQYMRRIRELEEELRLSRVENEKNVSNLWPIIVTHDISQRATIQRFRERWEKLKES